MFFSGTSFALGFASGFGTGFFTREVARIGRVSMRPAAKAVVRVSMTALEKAREAIATAGETFEDLVAEVRTELGTAPQQVAAATEGAANAVSAEAAKVAQSAHTGENAHHGQHREEGEKARGGKKG